MKMDNGKEFKVNTSLCTFVDGELLQKQIENGFDAVMLLGFKNDENGVETHTSMVGDVSALIAGEAIHKLFDSCFENGSSALAIAGMKHGLAEMLHDKSGDDEGIDGADLMKMMNELFN